MRRLVLALVLPAVALTGSDARAQWLFQPPEAGHNPPAKHPGESAAPVPSLGGGSPSPYDPEATEPAPSMEWDQSGIIGRRDRDAFWRHQERMSGIWGYLQGLQDGARAVRPIWGPYAPAPGPLPPVVGPPRQSKKP
jgi:hypothetical protein